jgi:RHS repeat-associated protein
VYSRNSGGTETLYVYGKDGKKLATYTIAGITGSQVNLTFQSQNVYFAGKLISAEGNAVAVDPMGSVRWSSAGSGTARTYYPYGAEYIATTGDTEKYATYTRDSLSGLDYAMNRYYSSFWDRFITPDPRWASARATDPGTVNRYTYARDDPADRSDPSGLCDVDIAGIRMSPGSQNGFAVYAENAVAVYPYSATASEFALAGIFGGILQVAQQKLGMTSQTYAAVAGILAAYSEGGPINVTTFSGGAQAFTSAVAYLNGAGLTDVTAQINNITYISPGAVGSLYNNNNAIVLLGNDLADQAATSNVSGWLGPIDYTNQFPLCGHDFACMWAQFQALLGSRSGSACPAAAVIGEANNSPLKLFDEPVLNQNDPFYWLDVELLDLGAGFSDLPTVSSNQPSPGDPSVTSAITFTGIVP